MNKNRLDQLFRDKLNQIEIEPSENALAKFDKQIAGKRGTAWWWYVAASLSLLAISVGIFWSTNSPESQIATKVETIDAKPEVESTEIEVQSILNEPVVAEVKSSQVENAPDKHDPIPKAEVFSKDETRPKDLIAELDNSSEIIDEANLESDATPSFTEPIILDFDSASLIAESNSVVPVVEETPSQPLPKVKITYISGRRKNRALIAQSEVRSDTADIKDGALNKIWNSARNLANGNLIADLRDVKENFFNKNDD